MKKFTLIRVLFPLITALILSVNANSQGNPFGCNGQFYISSSSGSATYSNGTLLDSLMFSSGIFTPGGFTTHSPNNMGFNGIGINPIDGFIYAIRYQSGAPSSQSHLIKIGRSGTSAVETDLGAIHVGTGYITGGDALAGCFDFDGTFYFSANSKLYKIPNAKLSVDSATLVGNTSSFADIAINPVSGQMYGSNGGTLYTVNKTTGAATSVHSFSPSVSLMAGLFFTPDGSLYGYSSNGNLWLINKTTAALTNAGTGPSYSNADGASCSFGQVVFTMTASGHNQICPIASNTNPVDTFTIAVTNQTSSQQTGLTFTLEIPGNRFSFIQSASTILDSLQADGILPLSATTANITISSTTGTNNKIVITSFQTGAVNKTQTFKLPIQLVTLGGTYDPVSSQAIITGLPAYLGIDYTDDPNTVAPGDPTTITFCQGITLPVTLLSFTGNYRNNTTLLNWEVDNQVNFASFEIQRSNDGFNFSTIGSEDAQAGSGTLQYQYSDDLSAASGNVFFYRLKMIDIDGKYSYSSVIMIRKDQQNINGFSIIPNPVINSMATIRFTSSSSGLTDIRVIDMTGKVVLHQQNNVYEGTNSISINNLSVLQPGIYTLQVLNGNTLLNNKFSIVR